MPLRPKITLCDWMACIYVINISIRGIMRSTNERAQRFMRIEFAMGYY
jgi:hypothetical protein